MALQRVSEWKQGCPLLWCGGKSRSTQINDTRRKLAAHIQRIGAKCIKTNGCLVDVFGREIGGSLTHWGRGDLVNLQCARLIPPYLVRLPQGVKIHNLSNGS